MVALPRTEKYGASKHKNKGIERQYQSLTGALGIKRKLVIRSGV